MAPSPTDPRGDSIDPASEASKRTTPKKATAPKKAAPSKKAAPAKKVAGAAKKATEQAPAKRATTKKAAGATNKANAPARTSNPTAPFSARPKGGGLFGQFDPPGALPGSMLDPPAPEPSAPAKRSAKPRATPPTPRRAQAPSSTGSRTPNAPNIPSTYKGPLSWFLSGFSRQEPGTFVALLAGYTALIVSLWYAVIGMILGILVAVGAIHSNSITQALFHAGAGTSVSAVAVVTGALVGAGGSFVSFYTHTIASNPYQVLGSVVGGAVLAVLIVAVTAAFEGNLLAVRGCRRLTVDEAKRISPMLQKIGAAYGLQNAPRIAVSSTRGVNAWAHMRHIVLTKGLLDSLDDQRLEAVIAHELHHWRMGDAVGQHLVWACAWPVVLVYNIAARISFGSPDSEVPRVRMPGFIIAIAWLVAWPAWLLVKLPITLAVRHDMRSQEYQADAAVKQIGYGPALIDALSTLSAFEGGRTGWETALYATHPTADERINALQVRAPGDRDYVEPALGNLSGLFLQGLGVVVIIFAALIASGAVLNAQRASTTHSTVAGSGSNGGAVNRPNPPAQPTIPISEVHAAEHTAAGFTTAIIDNAYSQAGYQGVVAQYAPTAAEQSALDSAASNYSFALGVDLSNVVSNASVLGCTLLSDSTVTTPDVGVFVRWTAGANVPPTSQWFTDHIALTQQAGNWVPSNVPDNLPGLPTPFAQPLPQYLSPTTPQGYTSCP